MTIARTKNSAMIPVISSVDVMVAELIPDTIESLTMLQTRLTGFTDEIALSQIGVDDVIG